MATHGAILLKHKRQEVFLHTSHDGHTDEAIRMILDLPKLIARNSWLPKIAKLTPENVQETLNRNAGAGFEWSILEFSAAIISTTFNRWLQIPKADIKHLAPWGQKPDLIVNITDPDNVKITVTDWSDDSCWAFLTDYPGTAISKDKPNQILAPLHSMYVEELLRISSGIQYSERQEEAANDED